jgi:hypothetical protein
MTLRRPLFVFMLVAAVAGGPTRVSAEEAGFVLPDRPVWQGEVFPLAYELAVPRSEFYNVDGLLEWDPAPIVIQEWSRPQLVERSIEGTPLAVVTYTTRAMAREAGAIILAPGRQKIVVRTGATTRSGAAQAPVTEIRALASPPQRLTVRPLPAPAPGGFTGGVGRFTLTGAVEPLTVEVGEPVRWTLTLDGEGSWPFISGLPPRSVSRDFRAPLPPEVRRTSREGALFTSTLAESVVLVPTKPGPHVLGPVTMAYFDPNRGTYETLEVPAVTITVTGTALAEDAPSAEAATASTAVAPADPIRPEAVLPGDPVLPAGEVPLPLSPEAWHRGLLLTLVLPGLAWLVFAVQRTWRRDPWRPQREARGHLVSTLRRLRSAADETARRPLLRRWQHDAALLWGRTEAAPIPEAFGPEATWGMLWREAEAALYAPAPTLSPDWVVRAEAALAAKRVRAFPFLRVFHPQNLAPFLAIVLVLGWTPDLQAQATTTAVVAADPIAAYRAGNFAAAEAAWRSAVQARPTDVAARYNLSLALAQRGRWGESAAQAIAAFVQDPRQPGVRAQLDLALDRAGYLPPEVVALQQANQLEAVILWASPAQWQRVVIACAGIGSLGLILLLAHGFHPDRHRLRAGLGLLAFGLIGAAVGGAALRVYGPFADRELHVVWRDTLLRSVPIEGEIAQETSALPAGALATVDRRFLGWSRLTFAEGATGWVRGEMLVPIWRASEAVAPVPIPPAGARPPLSGPAPAAR